MSRKEELLKYVGEDLNELVTNLVDEMLFLEGKLAELKQYPFLQVHPKDNAVQRATPAAKQYKEFLQQYNNCIKIIESIIYKDKRLDETEAEETPLRKWFKEHAN
jgi:hypothetical protein